jgi:hypothetical protein
MRLDLVKTRNFSKVTKAQSIFHKHLNLSLLRQSHHQTPTNLYEKPPSVPRRDRKTPGVYQVKTARSNKWPTNINSPAWVDRLQFQTPRGCRHRPFLLPPGLDMQPSPLPRDCLGKRNAQSGRKSTLGHLRGSIRDCAIDRGWVSGDGVCGAGMASF